jgi:hypothetical protein
MKKKVICIILTLLMCLMVTLPAFADSSLETIPQRAEITAVFGLKHVSGSSYRMWARISNPTGTSVTATLALYDASYNYITSVSKTSSNTTIGLDKNTTLSSGTYHLRLSYTADGANYSFEKTYII